jgi:hypothetical protein
VPTFLLRVILPPAIGSAFASVASPQRVGPQNGALVLSGAGEPHAEPSVLRRFVQLAGGPETEILYIPTAASGIRLPSGFIAELPASGAITPSTEALESELASLFGVRRVRVLRTRDQCRCGLRAVLRAAERRPRSLDRLRERWPACTLACQDSART